MKHYKERPSSIQITNFEINPFDATGPWPLWAKIISYFWPIQRRVKIVYKYRFNLEFDLVNRDTFTIFSKVKVGDFVEFFGTILVVTDIKPLVEGGWIGVVSIKSTNSISEYLTPADIQPFIYTFEQRIDGEVAIAFMKKSVAKMKAEIPNEGLALTDWHSAQMAKFKNQQE